MDLLIRKATIAADGSRIVLVADDAPGNGRLMVETPSQSRPVCLVAQDAEESLR